MVERGAGLAGGRDRACYRRPVIAEVRSFRFALGVALVAAASAGVALGTCGAPELATVPSIAWDGRALTAVWERGDGRHGATVFAHRFTDVRAGVTTVGADTPIYHQENGTPMHSPEIASDAAGSLVVIVGLLQAQIAIPLDATGAVAGPAQPLTSCRSDRSERVCMRACRGAVAFGDGFAFGHLDTWPRAGRGANAVAVSFLSRDGKTVRDVSVPAAIPSGCALASTGSRLVIAVAEQRMDGAYGIWIQVVDEFDRDGVWIPDAVRAIALVPTGADMALLYETRDGALRVARVDDRGVREQVVLATDVDAATADLGIGAHGPFVTWIVGQRVVIRDVATAASTRGTVRGDQPLGTRAVGVGDRCVAAWSASGGAKLGVLSTACP